MNQTMKAKKKKIFEIAMEKVKLLARSPKFNGFIIWMIISNTCMISSDKYPIS